MYNIVILSVLAISFAWASPDECQKDLSQFCSEEKEESKKFSCLAKNPDQLSDECRNELKRLNQVVKDTGIRSGGLSSFGGVAGGLGLVPPKKSIVTVEGMSAWEGEPTVIQQGKITLVSPMWIKDQQSFTASASAGTVKINEAVTLPDGDKIRELHRIEAGGQYTKMLDEKRMWGLRGSVGSAGDRPFATSREYTFSMNGFFAEPGKGESYWVYTFFLSNNNPLLNYVPIPGFIYFYRKENFTGMFGLPFMSIQWTPEKKWLLSLSYFITNFRSSLSYAISDEQQLSLNFAVNQQTFLREKREETRDRLFFNDKRIYAGWKTSLFGSMALEVQLGESLDRELREGKRFDDKEWVRNLGRSLYVSSALTVTY